LKSGDVWRSAESAPAWSSMTVIGPPVPGREEPRGEDAGGLHPCRARSECASRSARRRTTVYSWSAPGYLDDGRPSSGPSCEVERGEGARVGRGASRRIGPDNPPMNESPHPLGHRQGAARRRANSYPWLRRAPQAGRPAVARRKGQTLQRPHGPHDYLRLVGTETVPAMERRATSSPPRPRANGGVPDPHRSARRQRADKRTRGQNARTSIGPKPRPFRSAGD